MKEIWKDISGYEGIYQVSNLGEVRRVSNPKYRSRKNYIIAKGVAKNGYVYSNLWMKNSCKRAALHRLVAGAFIDNPMCKPIINHKDFDPLNNNSNNLEWVTQSENCQHAIAAGRLPNNKGENHGMSKLNERKVKEIISRKDEIGSKLAIEYGVSPQTIYDIKKGKRWKHLSNTQ